MDNDQPITIDSHGDPITPHHEPPKKHKLHFLDPRRKWNSLPRRHQIIVVATAVLVVFMGFLIARNLLSDKSQAAIDIDKAAAKPTTVASPLTGLPVAPDLAKRPVTGVIIENSPDARPQSGIADAGVIFEAIAEGGITRFLTLYQESRPGYIGPVRSLRSYYIDWAASFDAAIAHVGGSPDALSQIRNGGKDLDQFFNPGSYWREPSRPAPHDVYTNFDKLDDLNKSKGYTNSNFTPWPRKGDQKLATPHAKSIDLDVASGTTYDVHYDYDATSNSYHRKLGGGPHIATNSASDTTGTLLAPKVVIAMVMSYDVIDGSGHSAYGTTGTGTVYVFQDGFAVQGSWYKTDRTSQITFKDSSGQPIKLNAGQVWVTAIKDGGVSHGAQ